MPRGPAAADRPHSPFRPSTWAATKPVKARARQGRREVDCWDVRLRVDGRRYFRRFPTPMANASWVQKWVQTQYERFLLGWDFDPERREFVEPGSGAAATADGGAPPTVFSEAAGWMWRQWPTWQPKTRQSAARSLRRACLTLLRPGPDGVVPDPPTECAAYLEWLLAPGEAAEAVRNAVLLERRPPPDPTGAAADEWMAQHSLPFAEVGWPELERLLNTYSTNQHAQGRRVAPATERRMVADLCQFWADVVDRLDLPENPWERRSLQRRGPRGASSGIGLQPADPDLVLSPEEVWELARRCGEVAERTQAWGPEVIAFVLLMGWCGLRPGEAAAARVSGLRLPTQSGDWGQINVSRTRRTGVSDRWRDPEEDEEEGPLKLRGLNDSRAVPIPPGLADLLAIHVWLFCRWDSDLLFLRLGDRQPFDLNAFDKAIWQPARTSLFPSGAHDVRGAKLARLRRHDLRHAACSAWLAAGVSPKIAQLWSGHKRLSVFLDVYQGVLPDDHSTAVRRWGSYMQGRSFDVTSTDK